MVIATGPANALLAWQADADAVLTRPFPAEALHDAIASTLRRPEGERPATRLHEISQLTP